ncbi:hypothetical protein QUB63_10980 [Microcoleus sp. ARI1-B5]
MTYELRVWIARLRLDAFGKLVLIEFLASQTEGKLRHQLFAIGKIP